MQKEKTKKKKTEKPKPAERDCLCGPTRSALEGSGMHSLDAINKNTSNSHGPQTPGPSQSAHWLPVVGNRLRYGGLVFSEGTPTFSAQIETGHFGEAPSRLAGRFPD